MNITSRLMKGADMQVFPVPAGTSRVICFSGVIWLTAEGIHEDVLLEPGMEADLTDMNNVCLQGIGDSEFELI